MAIYGVFGPDCGFTPLAVTGARSVEEAVEGIKYFNEALEPYTEMFAVYKVGEEPWKKSTKVVVAELNL